MDLGELFLFFSSSEEETLAFILEHSRNMSSPSLTTATCVVCNKFGGMCVAAARSYLVL